MASKSSGSRRCSAANCNGTEHLFSFPKDDQRKHKWITWVSTKVSNFQWNGAKCLCWRHFAPEDFVNLNPYIAGINDRFALEPGALPSRHFNSEQESAAMMTPRRRKAADDQEPTPRRLKSRLVRDALYARSLRTTKCWAVGCNTSNARQKFPDDIKRRIIWSVQVNKHNENHILQIATPQDYLCDAHFAPSQWLPKLPGVLRHDAVPRVFNPYNVSKNKAMIEQQSRSKEKKCLIISADHNYADAFTIEDSIGESQVNASRLEDGLPSVYPDDSLASTSHASPFKLTSTPSHVTQAHKLASEMREEKEVAQTAHVDISDAVKKLLLAAAYTTGFDAEVTVCVSKDKRCQFFSYPPCEEIDKRIRETCLLKSSLAAQDLCEEFHKLDLSLFMSEEDNSSNDVPVISQVKSVLVSQDKYEEEDNSPCDVDVKLEVECKAEPEDPATPSDCCVAGDLDIADLNTNLVPEDAHQDMQAEEKSVSTAKVVLRRLPARVRAHGQQPVAEKPFKCSFCDEHFRLSREAKSHEQAKHPGMAVPPGACRRRATIEKPWQCTVCGKRVRFKNELMIHQRIHTGERPFPCSVCGKGFRERKSANAHEAIHRLEKMFLCSFCGKKFLREAARRSHERIHTGEKPFKCSHCEKSFRFKHHLEGHELQHGVKRDKCSTRGKRFDQLDEKREHERTHACQHQLTHTDDKPRQCS